jgi:hypothetical protein
MTELVNAIDEYTSENFGYLDPVKLWGFCELSYKSATDTGGTVQGATSTQPIVMTVPDSPVRNGSRQSVSLQDKYNFITWVRWIEPARGQINPAFQYGSQEQDEYILPLRIVVAHKATLGENLIFSFAKGLPKKIVNSGFDYIFMEGRANVNPDHESIYQTELGNTAYEKHRFTWNIYTVDVTYRFMYCEETTP